MEGSDGLYSCQLLTSSISPVRFATKRSLFRSRQTSSICSTVIAFSIIPKPFFLYRMGHSGNVSSREQLSRTFDIAHGRVVLCTACVLLKALQREKIPRIRWMRGRNREMGSWWLMAPSFPLPFIYYQKKEFLR